MSKYTFNTILCRHVKNLGNFKASERRGEFWVYTFFIWCLVNMVWEFSRIFFANLSFVLNRPELDIFNTTAAFTFFVILYTVLLTAAKVRRANDARISKKVILSIIALQIGARVYDHVYHELLALMLDIVLCIVALIIFLYPSRRENNKNYNPTVFPEAEPDYVETTRTASTYRDEPTAARNEKQEVTQSTSPNATTNVDSQANTDVSLNTDQASTSNQTTASERTTASEQEATSKVNLTKDPNSLKVNLRKKKPNPTNADNPAETDTLDAVEVTVENPTPLKVDLRKNK
ncbi:DUF805 domain-containing protein [Psittacicella hinzii]|uniref:DUF805 domain-containing protein n=1 Tax=Psittacicella hinzii TaxID=2028575 RepID=A0A3A1YHP9_9GAMM|nr:DUF805 domain-containing protein [Psittacicella hinzii]RIY37131.1 hypothetical protein CKF58_05255 [Psittacicella hinzii]